MYVYIYDTFLADQKYQKTLVQVETKITDLGINGKIHRLSPLKNLRDILSRETKKGSNTIVMVGNDASIGQIISLVAGQDTTLGIIPVGKENNIANTLGINSIAEACEILSARRVEKLDLGKINSHYFLYSAEILSNNVAIEIDGKYKIDPTLMRNKIHVFNLKYSPNSKSIFDPQDGVMETIIEPEGGFLNRVTSANTDQQSFFPGKKIEIRGKKGVQILTDNRNILNAPATIEVAPKKLNVIVGKKRLF